MISVVFLVSVAPKKLKHSKRKAEDYLEEKNHQNELISLLFNVGLFVLGIFSIFHNFCVFSSISTNTDHPFGVLEN